MGASIKRSISSSTAVRQLTTFSLEKNLMPLSEKGLWDALMTIPACGRDRARQVSDCGGGHRPEHRDKMDAG